MFKFLKFDFSILLQKEKGRFSLTIEIKRPIL